MSRTLDRVEIRTPCPMDWDLMEGNDQVRFCGRCKKNVFNIKAMTEAEAVSLFEDSGEQVCARIYRRDDGTVVTSDCPPRSNSPLAGRRKPLQFSMAFLMVLVTFSAGLAASAPWIGTKIQPLIERFSRLPRGTPSRWGSNGYGRYGRSHASVQNPCRSFKVKS